jgi:hypothetical protein
MKVTAGTETISLNKRYAHNSVSVSRRAGRLIIKLSLVNVVNIAKYLISTNIGIVASTDLRLTAAYSTQLIVHSDDS